MDVKSRKQPSHYPFLPFHAIRVVSFITATVVTAILIYFCYQLKHDGFKVPWTFLIVLAASIISILVLIVTSIVQCCARISPLFNLILNVLLLILWIVGMSLLAWNVYGTLSHSCTIANWANDQGVMVCQTYKALFAFVIFGTLAQIAQVVVDVRARREQTRSGAYAKMGGSDASSLKLEPYRGASDPILPASNDSSYDMPGWRPGLATNNSSYDMPGSRPLPSSNNSVWDRPGSRPVPSTNNSSYNSSYVMPGWRPQYAHGEANNYYSNRY